MIFKSNGNIKGISKDIQFILTHFKGQEFEFPRTLTTAKTVGQVCVQTEEEMIKYFLESGFTDCRINGYPFLYKSNENNRLYPSIIFIDLDLSSCNICKYPIRKLEYILNYTLNKIHDEIGGHPTVLWTGGAYHIYQPIRITAGRKMPLEVYKEFKEFIPIASIDLSTEFIRFANKYLTSEKAILNYNPSTKSCLMRIPETINSKYNEKVRIVQRWNGNEADAKSLIPIFLNELTQLNQDRV